MKGTYSVAVMCTQLDVSTSGYFHWLGRLRDGDCSTSTRCSDGAALAHIRAIHAEVKGEYGWPRMHKELQARGLRMGKERVRKFRQSMEFVPKPSANSWSRRIANTACRYRQTWCSATSFLKLPISFGAVTSPILRPTRGGCTWPQSLTCSAVRWWAGVCKSTCKPAWSKTRSQWPGGVADHPQAPSSTAIGVANIAAINFRRHSQNGRYAHP